MNKWRLLNPFPTLFVLDTNSDFTISPLDNSRDNTRVFCTYHVSITEAPVRGGVGNPPGLTVSVDPGHRAVWVSPDPGPTPGQPEAW